VAVDRTISQWAADPEFVTFIKIIDCFFDELTAQAYPALVGKTPEQRIEDYWLMLKQGTLRLRDPEIDDDDAFVVQTENPGQQARARVVGAKLYAIRRHLVRAQRAKAARGTDTSLGLTKS